MSALFLHETNSILMVIGELVKSKLDASNKKVEDLGEALNLGRRRVYDLFGTNEWKVDQLKIASELLNYNFFQHIISEELVGASEVHDRPEEYRSRSATHPIRLVLEIDTNNINTDKTAAFIEKMQRAIKEFETDS